MTLTFQIAQLRHAYSQLCQGTVKNQKAFAEGLLGPVIRALEELDAESQLLAEQIRKISKV